jgi:hypothetical protein
MMGRMTTRSAMPKTRILAACVCVALLIAGRSTAAAQSPAEPADEQAVQRFLRSWGATQQLGHFAVYEALYAPSFEGVRRSGEHVFKLSRTAWMAERRRMFKRGFELQVDESYGITRNGERYSVELYQGFRSGNYTDSGTKLLLLEPRGDTFSIVYEEMLSSTARTLLIADERFLFMIAGLPYVVLLEAPDSSWSAGAYGF